MAAVRPLFPSLLISPFLPGRNMNFHVSVYDTERLVLNIVPRQSPSSPLFSPVGKLLLTRARDVFSEM